MTKPWNAIFTLLVKNLLTNCKNFLPVQAGARISAASGGERRFINWPMSETSSLPLAVLIRRSQAPKYLHG
jgi:hypothetical protein